MQYHRIYPHRQQKERICYTILSTFISLWIFVVTSYYIESGVPFSDLFLYNKIIANIIFYISYGLVGLITYLEHFKWKKLMIIDQNDLQSEIITNQDNKNEIEI